VGNARRFTAIILRHSQQMEAHPGEHAEGMQPGDVGARERIANSVFNAGHPREHAHQAALFARKTDKDRSVLADISVRNVAPENLALFSIDDVFGARDV